MNLTALLLCVLGATQLHAGPPGYASALGAEPLISGLVSAQVQAWPGSEALLELVLDNDETALVNAGIEVESPDKSLRPPVLWQVGADSDVLLPVPEYWSLGAHSRRTFLLRYAVPVNARPGRHQHAVRLHSHELTRSVEFNVTLEVVELPATVVAPLPASGGITWPPPALRQLAEPEARAGLFAAWSGVPALLWPRPAPGAQLRPDDLTPFMQAQARLESLAPVDLAPLLPVESAAPKGFSQQLESARLGRWPDWAREVVWSSGVQVELPVSGGTDAVAGMAALVERYRKEVPAVGLLLSGPFLPGLQGRSDAWALPEPEAGRISEALFNGEPAVEWAASELTLLHASDAMPYEACPTLLASPSHALDGSPSTWWATVPAQSAFIELENPKGLRVESLHVFGDAAPRAVISGFDGQPKSESSVTWREENPQHWSGKLKYPATFNYLRLEFASAPKRGQRIREIVVNAPRSPDPSESYTRVLPWITLPAPATGRSLLDSILSAEAAGGVGIRLGVAEFLPAPATLGGDTTLIPARDGRSAKSVGGKRKSSGGGEATSPPLTTAAPPQAPPSREGIVAGYWDGARALPSLQALRLAEALRDAALMRAARAVGRLDSDAEAAFRQAVLDLTQPAESLEQRLQRVERLARARADILAALTGKKRKANAL